METFVPWIKVKYQLSDLLEEHGGEDQLANSVKMQLKDIQIKFESIETLLHNAESEWRKAKGEAFRPRQAWLAQIIYDIEDVLFDEYWNKPLMAVNDHQGSQLKPTKVLRLLDKVRSTIPSLRSCLDRVSVLHSTDDITKKTEEINRKLQAVCIELKRQFLWFPYPRRYKLYSDDFNYQSSRLVGPSIIDESEIYGREDDKISLLSHLLAKPENRARDVKVIYIVGCGGSGKTTLAQLLYHNDRVRDDFQLRAWVCVSNCFDERRSAQDLLDCSMSCRDYNKESELESLFQLIQDAFSGKVFLCVFDDVSIEEYSKWIRFVSLLKNGAPGSIILVTARSDRVKRVLRPNYTHCLKPLSNKDCWSILKHTAMFGRRELCNEVKKIGSKIAKKCEGSPLAASILGDLLLYKDTAKEWQNVLDCEIWEIEEVAMELFRHFYSSYDKLSPQLKLCILFCAAFPKSTVMNVDQLIRLWMAEGYLGHHYCQSDDKRMEMKGMEYFNDLVNQSFFQELVTGSIHKNRITSCKLHDTFHDFIQYKARHELLGGLCRKKASGSAVCHYGKVDSYRCLEDVRALVLSYCQPDELPSKVRSFAHLQYLDLRGNPLNQLPETICTLHYLMFLDVRFCYLLSCRPQKIGELKQLKHLRIDYTTDELHNLPQGFEELTLIRTLDVFRTGGRYKDSIVKLKVLNHLEEICIAVHGEIHFQDADFGSKTHMENLEFCFVGEGRDQEQATSSIWDMEPPPNLQMLKFEGYPGPQLPNWILEEPLMNNLRRLSLKSALNISSLPALWKLSSLEFLWLYDIPNLKYLSLEFFGLHKAVLSGKENQKTLSDQDDEKTDVEIIALEDDDYDSCYCSEDDEEITVEENGHPDAEIAVAFKSLKTFRIEYLQNWEEWEDIPDECDEKKRNQITVMPSLEELIIASCPKLGRLPNCILGKIPLLRIEVNGQLDHTNRYSGDQSS